MRPITGALLLPVVMSSSLHLRRFRSDPVIIAAGSPA
jgi:hypothetical protein